MLQVCRKTGSDVVIWTVILWSLGRTVCGHLDGKATVVCQVREEKPNALISQSIAARASSYKREGTTCGSAS